jgi:hypothetical protein
MKYYLQIFLTSWKFGEIAQLRMPRQIQEAISMNGGRIYRRQWSVDKIGDLKSFIPRRHIQSKMLKQKRPENNFSSTENYTTYRKRRLSLNNVSWQVTKLPENGFWDGDMPTSTALLTRFPSLSPRPPAQ